MAYILDYIGALGMSLGIARARDVHISHALDILDKLACICKVAPHLPLYSVASQSKYVLHSYVDKVLQRLAHLLLRGIDTRQMRQRLYTVVVLDDLCQLRSARILTAARAVRDRYIIWSDIFELRQRVVYLAYIVVDFRGKYLKRIDHLFLLK